MKQFLLAFFFSFCASNLFSQLNLDHSFTHGVFARFLYTDDSNTNYIFFEEGNILKIYDGNYELYKTLNIPIDTDFSFLGDNYLNQKFQVSKYVFNEDEKLEFAFPFKNDDTNESALLIFNEDGEIIHEFGDEYWWSFEVFHDYTIGQNKFVITKVQGTNIITEVYLLSTTELTTKEIQSEERLMAFPVPTENELHIINPLNGADKIVFFDMNGSLILSQSFNQNSNIISVDVSSLPKGIYIYRIGNLESRIIKK